MKKINSLALMAVGFLGFTSPVTLPAAEHWTRYEPQSVPWVKPLHVKAFKNMVYVSAEKSKTGDSSRLWRSIDGVTWQPAPVPTGFGSGQTFTEHKNYLYAFTVDLNVSSMTPPRQIFRTQDGETWQKMNGNFGTGMWADSISHTNPLNGTSYILGAYLDFTPSAYPLINPGKMVRSTGDGANPSWSITPGPTWFGTPAAIKFGSHDGWLYANIKVTAIFGGVTQDHVMRSRDGGSWAERTTALNTPTTDISLGMESDGNYIFRSLDQSLLKNTDESVGYPFYYQWPVSLIAEKPIPLMVHDQLHVFVSSAPIRILNSQNQWETAAPQGLPVCHSGVSAYEINMDKFDEAAHLNNMAFIIPCDLWMLKKGVAEVIPQSIQTESVAFGQKNTKLLAWSLKVNFGDQMKGLKIKNNGSAKAGTDIEKVKLFLESSDPRLQPTLVTELTADPTGKTWLLPAGFQLPLQDGDRFFIGVDISKTPTDQATIQMKVENLTWQSGEHNFSGFPLVASIQQTIVGVSAAPGSAIEGVMVYPSPARDTVNFLYDLAYESQVQVKIFNRNGQLVSEVNDPSKPAGNRSKTTWDASSMAPGTYFALIEINPVVGEKIVTKKMVFIKR